MRAYILVGRGRNFHTLHVLKIVDLPDVRTSYVTISSRPSVIKRNTTNSTCVCVCVCAMRATNISFRIRMAIYTHTHRIPNWVKCVEQRAASAGLWIAREWPRGTSSHALAPCDPRVSFSSGADGDGGCHANDGVSRAHDFDSTATFSDRSYTIRLSPPCLNLE